jgi:hypothetical protein
MTADWWHILIVDQGFWEKSFAKKKEIGISLYCSFVLSWAADLAEHDKNHSNAYSA